VDICCLVQVGDGEDLANTVISRAETKDFKTIIRELQANVAKYRQKKVADHNKRMGIIQFLPTFLIGPIIQFTSYLANIGLAVKLLGVKKYEFGSCVLTSIGSIGVEDGYPPIPPLTFAPLLVSVCKKKTKYSYDENNKIQEKITLGLDFTIDERFIDAKDAEGVNRDVKDK
jgi:hypothetical protein